MFSQFCLCKWLKLGGRVAFKLRADSHQNASARFHQFDASVRRILFNVMLRKQRYVNNVALCAFTHNASVRFAMIRLFGCSGASGRGLKFNIWTLHFPAFIRFYWWPGLAYFTVKFDHIWLQNINLLI